jgi:CheY-like chemotaxis protein
MKMPFMGGLDVLSQIKQMPTWEAVPFIIFSTSSLVQDIRNCMDKGALAFYTKPNTFPETRLIINEMILGCKDHTFSNSPMYSQ